MRRKYMPVRCGQVVIFSFLIGLFSCKATQQVVEVGSQKVPVTNGVFVAENDTLSISYDFWNYYGQMKFTIYNKLDVPVYIDWKNAGFIVNGQSMPYYVDASQSKTKSSAGSYYYYSEQTFGSSTTTTVRSERITTLLPHSKITRFQYKLYKGYQLSPKNMRKIPITDRVNGFIKDYNSTESPQYFRNFIMYSVHEDMVKPQQIDHEFYFSKLMMVKTKDVSKLSAYTRFYITDSKLKLAVGKEYKR